MKRSTPRARIQKLVILRGSEHLRRWFPRTRVDMVFNYPTLAETYKVAALDGLNKL
jgi:hypothetical protein